MTLIIRFLAVFVYIIAALLALKSLANLSSEKTAIAGDWGWTLVTLLACIIISIGVWLVDRHYCDRKKSG